MFSLLWRFLRYALGLFCFVSLVIVLLVVDFSPPKIPSTSLGTLEARAYYLALTDLSNTPPGGTAEVVLSPRETSYILEQYHPEQSRYGFRITDVYLDARGANSRIRAVLRGPMGFYVLVKYVGTVHVKDGQWIFKPESLSLGHLPVSWIVPGQWSVEASTTFAGGSVEVQSGRLNGQGLKATVVNHGIQLELSGGLLDQL